MAIHPAAPSSTSHSLSFPAQAFAKLSPHPFLHAHLSSSNSPVRPSGRSPSDTRPPTLHTGSLSHARGSAVVRIGDTAAVCGVRGEILLTKDIADWKHPSDVNAPPSLYSASNAEEEKLKSHANEIARLNLLVPNVELSTGCSPAHLPGSPPSDLAQTLSHRVLSLLHISQLLSVDDLRVWYHPPSTSAAAALAPNPNNPDAMVVEEDDQQEKAEEAKAEIKAYWCLHITILFISLDGNPFDAAWGALLAALRDTRLPRAWWDADSEMVLCSPNATEAHKLRLHGLPIPLTFGVFVADGQDRMLGPGGGGKEKKDSWILADMDAFEEGCVREEVCVVMDGEVVVRLEKGGGGVVGMGEMRGLVERAQERWREWKGVLGGI